METRVGRRIKRPLPLNTLYYKFPPPLNDLLRREWERVYREPFLTEALPTAPFRAYRNHHSVGALLSHMRRTFHTIPCQAMLQPDHMMTFAPQKFNRPRRRGVLIKTRPPITLRSVDLTCGNNRCHSVSSLGTSELCGLNRPPNHTSSRYQFELLYQGSCVSAYAP